MTTADVTDRQGALNAIGEHTENLSAVSIVLTDGGYTRQPFADTVLALIGAKVHVVKRSDLPAFSVISKRWVVEKSFAWLEKCRRIWKNTERLLNTSLQFVNLALLLRRF